MDWTERQDTCQNEEKEKEEGRGKAGSLVGQTGSTFTWRGAVVKLQALLDSEQQAA